MIASTLASAGLKCTPPARCELSATSTLVLLCGRNRCCACILMQEELLESVGSALLRADATFRGVVMMRYSCVFVGTLTLPLVLSACVCLCLLV